MTAQSPDTPRGLEELAGRVERATGPDRELDLQIAKALGLRAQHLSFIPGGSDLAWSAKGGGCGFRVERYTASLDAAMTLVPEGWLLQGLMERNAVGEHNWRWKADLWTPKWDKGVRGVARVAHRDPSAPALALTAAALRAHIQGNDNG